MRWLLLLFLALGIVEAHAVDVGIYNEPQSSSAGAAAAISGSAINPSSITTGNISATNISASGNEDVTGTLKVVGATTLTGLLTTSGGVSNTGNASVTGNLDVTGTTKVQGISATTIGATGVISGSVGLVISSSTGNVSFTMVGPLYLESAAPTIQQNRPGTGLILTEVYNPLALGFRISPTATPMLKIDANGIILGKTSTGVSSPNTAFVSGSLGVNGGVSLTGLAGGNGTSALCVNGAGVVTSSTLCVTSSGLVKENITPITRGLAEIMQLRPVTFTYKPGFGAKERGPQVGLIAEDVQKVIPEISFANGPYLSVNYMALTAVLVQGMQEQEQQIRQLQGAIDELRILNGLQPFDGRPWWRRWLGIE